jgi:hypothetical protein
MALVVRRGGLVVVVVVAVGTAALGLGVGVGLRLSRSREDVRQWGEEEEGGIVETGSSSLLLRSRYTPSGR